MNIKQRLEKDLKTAMLAGDKFKVTTLRGLKSSILNVEVAEGSRENGLNNQRIISLLNKEAKQRQESADMYVSAGSQQKADQELAEKKIISQYLPEQMSESELRSVVEKIATEANYSEMRQMGQLIADVKDKTKGTAEGSMIAKLAKEYLTK